MKIAVNFAGTRVDHIYPAAGMEVLLAAATMVDLIKAGKCVAWRAVRAALLPKTK